jgi:hypothetical protein
MIMNKQLLSMAFVVCLGLAAAPLFAEVITAPTPPTPMTAPATTPAEHKAAAELHKQHAEYHRSNAAHDRSLAAMYGSNGIQGLKRQNEILADHEDKFAIQNDKTAVEHYKLATPK